MAKPEPLPQSVIVGCNTWNCASKISNANWETKLNEQVNVNQGDSIGVKASFIDTRGSASGNIVIAKDTEISLEYYFYWCNTFNSCDASGLIQTPASPDASNNLNQQVLVGGSIDYIMGDIVPNIPAYYTSHTNGEPYTATGINDADGLPYLVMQSTNEFPVAPVVGAEEDALNIVVGDIYIITQIGLVINWAYAGVLGGNYNKLPADWNLQTTYFTATHNPWFNLPTSAFIPAALAAPLPYITYEITNVGATDWVAIDPGLASNIIPATQMVNGGRYSIVSLGTLDFQYYGADENQVGVVFTATIPPALPPAFPQTITTAIFLANVGTWFVAASGGAVFGEDPADSLDVVIAMDPTDGALSLTSFTGGGQWLSTDGGSVVGSWSIPGSYFGFSDGTPSASAFVTLQGFTATITGFPVASLSPGVLYTVEDVGVMDGSNPPFTWDLVSNSFPKTTTANMAIGTSYQVVFPQTTTLIIDCDNFGQISEIFTASVASIAPANPQLYNTSTTIGSDCTLENEQGIQYMDYLIQTPAYRCSIVINANYTTGLYEYASYDTSELGSGPNSGSPFSELPLGAPVSSNVLTLSVLPNLQSANTNPITFVSNLITPGNPGGGFDEGNVYTMTCNDFIPNAQNLIQFAGAGETFACTAAYEGTGSTATVRGYTLATATITGTGYVNGTVESSIIEVGTIVHAINPDPALPVDQGGTATVSAYQAGSNIPFQYDGFVAGYTPPTTKLDVRPVKKRWSMNLKAGSYNPSTLSEQISREMSRQKIKRVNNVQGAIVPQGGGSGAVVSTLTVPTDNIYNNVPPENVWADPNSGGSNTFYDSKNPAVYNFPPELNYNLPPDNNDDMPFLFCPAMNSSILNNDPTDASNNYIYAEIPHPNANGLNNLPVPTWYVNLIPLCSDVLSISPTLNTINASEFSSYSILPFYSQNSLANNGEINVGNSGIFPVVFGATETSLLYNNEGNGLFSFNYLHTPIYAFLSSNTNDLTECTAHMYTTQKVSTNMKGTNYFTTLIDKKSGILLHKMEPQSFWSQLGFDVPSLTVDLDKPIGKLPYQMTFNEFQAKTTGGFCGSANIFNGNFKTANSADQPCVADTELIYLTATPAQNTSYPVINAYNNSPGLTIGVEYLIVAHGGVYTNEQGQTAQLFDWSSIGGPNTGNNPNGTIFTATSTGFDPAHPPNGAYAWWDPPNPPKVKQQATVLLTQTQLQNNYFTVQTTNSLDAVRIPTVRDQTGHFLIEITGYNSIYLDDKSKKEIKSIVSSYFVSQGSFVAQVFPESYNYYHVGAPISLSNLKIRILDPYTGEEAQIGPNSSVYIQINKMLSDIAIAQVAN